MAERQGIQVVFLFHVSMEQAELFRRQCICQSFRRLISGGPRGLIGRIRFQRLVLFLIQVLGQDVGQFHDGYPFLYITVC